MTVPSSHGVVPRDVSHTRIQAYVHHLRSPALVASPASLVRFPFGASVKVVANAVAALSEIGDTSGQDVMEIDTSVLQKLLAALNECTEWGQVL